MVSERIVGHVAHVSPTPRLYDSATPDRWHHYHHYGVPPRSAGFSCLVSCVVWWRTLLFYIVQWNDFDIEMEASLGYLSLANFVLASKGILSCLLAKPNANALSCPTGKALWGFSFLPDIS